MPDERVGAFLARSHRRVLEHCDALLGRPLPDEQRSRLVALRASAAANLQGRESGGSGERQPSVSTSRVLEPA
jgi:hypothetical protein